MHSMSSEGNCSRAEWIQKQKHLLELERKAEIESSSQQCKDTSLKSLEAKGIILTNLVLEEILTGIYGKPTAVLAHKSHMGSQPILPVHSFSSGDTVGIWAPGQGTQGYEQVTSGIVSKVTTTTVHIALDEDVQQLSDLSDDCVFRLHKLANDVTYRRIQEGLSSLGKDENGPSSPLVSVLFGESRPSDPCPQLPPQLCDAHSHLQFFNRFLDVSQQEAVEFALKRKDLAIIHGPPGTGKTVTCIEVIRQYVKLGCKVLATAPSNLAVDNLLERLVDVGVRTVRIGHPARATQNAQSRTLDTLIHNSEESNILCDIRKEIQDTLGKIKKTKERGKRGHLWSEIKNLRKELRGREVRLTKQILSSSQVVLVTLTSSAQDGPLKCLGPSHFDLTVIDECSQGLESSCYTAILLSPKLLIAGDHKQLPPTIISPEAAMMGLMLSLMERLIDKYGDEVVHMLKVQYRMHMDIMLWASHALYGGQLVAHDSVAKHLLLDLPGVADTEETQVACLLIDTAGCDCYEMQGEDLSKGNEGEAQIVATHVQTLLVAGVKESDIAVITPYNLQVGMIRSLLQDKWPHVEVRSVDGFQGREKEAVVISLVRSNKKGEVGFLSEDRRLNVAVTRAKRHLAVVCDTSTVARHNFLKSLVDHLSRNGIVKSAYEFQDVLEGLTIGSEEPAIKSKLCVGTKLHLNHSSSTAKPKKKAFRHPAKPSVERQLLSQERKTEYEKLLDQFVSSSDEELAFPMTLSSYERLLIHELASAKGLKHVSRGTGRSRRIFVVKSFCTKIPGAGESVDDGGSSEEECRVVDGDGLSEDEGDDATNSAKDADDEDQEDDVQFEDETELFRDIAGRMGKLPKHNYPVEGHLLEPQATTEDALSERMCRICGKSILACNFTVHTVQCERRRPVKDQAKETRDTQKEERIATRKIAEKKKIKANQTGKDNTDDDFDEVITQFQKESNTCSYPRCKVPTATIFQLCMYCRKTFCLSHHLAEVHGCGEEARKYARNVLLKVTRGGVLTPGSGIPSRKPNPTIRAHLHRKLEKKLNKMADDRRPQKPDKKT